MLPSREEVKIAKHNFDIFSAMSINGKKLTTDIFEIIKDILQAYIDGELVEKMSEEDYKAILDKWGEGNNAIPETLGFRAKLAKALSKGKVKP